MNMTATVLHQYDVTLEEPTMDHDDDGDVMASSPPPVRETVLRVVVWFYSWRPAPLPGPPDQRLAADAGLMGGGDTGGGGEFSVGQEEKLRLLLLVLRTTERRRRRRRRMK